MRLHGNNVGIIGELTVPCDMGTLKVERQAERISQMTHKFLVDTSKR
jgi:hypothetical protein